MYNFLKALAGILGEINMNDPGKVETPDEEYVSPTSDETLKERYERIRREEAAMTDEERARLLARLREPSDLFEDINEEDNGEKLENSSSV